MVYVIEHRILHAMCPLFTFKWYLMLLLFCLFSCCYWSFPMTVHWRHCERLSLRFLDHDKLHLYLIWRKYTEHSRFRGHLPHDTDLGFSKWWYLRLSTLGHWWGLFTACWIIIIIMKFRATTIDWITTMHQVWHWPFQLDHFI